MVTEIVQTPKEKFSNKPGNDTIKFSKWDTSRIFPRKNLLWFKSENSLNCAKLLFSCSQTTYYHLCRSSRLQIFFEIAVLKNSTTFTGIYLWDFIKKKLQHMCFSVNIKKFFKTALFTQHLRWRLLLMQCHWVQTSYCRILIMTWIKL